MKKWQIILPCVVIGLFALFLTLAVRGSRSTRPGTFVPVPPQGSQMPSSEFLAEYDQFIALSTDVGKRQDRLTHSSAYKTFQQEQDEARGMAARLNSLVPQGYIFDEKYRAFTKQQIAIAPPTEPAKK